MQGALEGCESGSVWQGLGTHPASPPAPGQRCPPLPDWQHRLGQCLSLCSRCGHPLRQSGPLKHCLVLDHQSGSWWQCCQASCSCSRCQCLQQTRQRSDKVYAEQSGQDGGRHTTSGSRGHCAASACCSNCHADQQSLSLVTRADKRSLNGKGCTHQRCSHRCQNCPCLQSDSWWQCCQASCSCSHRQCLQQTRRRSTRCTLRKVDKMQANRQLQDLACHSRPLCSKHLMQQLQC